MKALIKKAVGYGNMEVMEIEEPKAERNLVKVKVKYCGICGSDLHAYEGTYSSTTPPVVLGHEFSGEVVEVGPDVKHVKVGDRVTSETTFQTCGKCEQCLTKNYNLCSNRKGIGTQVNGAMAEYVLSREESIHVLPENVSYLSACLSEPMACGIHASLEKTQIKAGDVVCVFGPGAIGLLLSQVVKAKGAIVILAGITKDYKRLELAKEMGMIVVDQLTEDIQDNINKLTNNNGVDIAFECSGSVAALNTALKITRKRGSVIQMGVFPKDFNEIDTESILQKEIVYIGSRSQKPSSWEKTMKLLGEKVITPEKIVTSIISLKDWEKGFIDSIDAKDIKVVIDLSL